MVSTVKIKPRLSSLTADKPYDSITTSNLKDLCKLFNILDQHIYDKLLKWLTKHFKLHKWFQQLNVNIYKPSSKHTWFRAIKWAMTTVCFCLNYTKWIKHRRKSCSCLVKTILTRTCTKTTTGDKKPLTYSKTNKTWAPKLWVSPL